MRRMFDEKEIKELGAESAVAEIAGGNVENAKPIYCHPVYLQFRKTDVLCCLTMLIFNNSETAFTKESFVAWVKNLVNVINNTAKILTSGFYQTLPACCLQRKDDDNAYLVCSNTNTSASLITLNYVNDIVENTECIVEDGVNKIN